MAVLYEYRDESLYYHHSRDEQPAAEMFPMHTHEMNELCYFLAGKGRFRVEGSAYPLEPGSLMIMRTGESHRIQIESDCPYERVVLHFAPALVRQLDPDMLLLEPFIRRPLGRYNLYDRTAVRSGAILEHMDAMATVLDVTADPYRRRLAILIHLYPVLAEVSAGFGRLLTSGEAAADSLVRDVIAYINAHLSDDLSLDRLCARFFISKSQLGRLFRQATGSSVWEYVLIKRLFLARPLIRSGQPAAAVCRACGFRDYSAFFRAYKKRFGCSPQEDRAVPEAALRENGGIQMPSAVVY